MRDSGEYERRATIVTSNRDHAEWPEAFLLASAAFDRLAHRADRFSITEPSCRASQAPQTPAKAS